MWIGQTAVAHAIFEQRYGHHGYQQTMIKLLFKLKFYEAMFFVVQLIKKGVDDDC